MNLTLQQPLIKKNTSGGESQSLQLVSMKNKRTSSDEQEELFQPVMQKQQQLNQFEMILNKVPTFNPDNWLVFIWRFIILLFVITYFFLIPVFIFFGSEIISDDIAVYWLYHLVVVIIIMLYLDIFVSFNTGYFDKGLLISDKQKIFMRYLTEEFIFDFIAVMALTLQSAFKDIYAFFVWVPFLFYLKFYFLANMDEQIQEILQLQRKAKATYQILKLFLSVLFIVHLFTCFFYGAGNYSITHTDNNSWLLQSGLQDDIYLLPIRFRYEYSFYWALTTMLTVGYGDITGKNPLEIFVSIVTMTFACVIFAMFISAFQGIFAEINASNLQFEKKMTDINRFMRDKNIDGDTQQKVRRFFTFIQSEKVRDFNEQIQAINQLGPQLKDEVIMQSYGYILRRVCWVIQFSLDFQRKLAYIVTEQMYSNGEIIFRQQLNHTTGNNDNDSLYYINIGGINLQINLTNDDQVMIYNQLEKDSFFGEIEFLTAQERRMTAQCTSITLLYKVRRQDFIDLLMLFPLDHQVFCMLRDSLTFNNYSAINVNCFSCLSQQHLAWDCPKTHYCPNRVELIRELMKPENNRQPFGRRKFKQRNLNILKLKNAQQIVQLEIQQASDDEDDTPLTSRLLTQQHHHSFSHSQLDISDDEQYIGIIPRYESKKQLAFMDLDQVHNFKNYFPKYNILSLLKLQRNQRRLSRLSQII